MTRAAQRRSRWMPCAARSTAGTRSTRFGLFSPRRAGATSRLGPAARRCAPALGSGLRLEASARSTSRVLTRIPTAGTGHTRRRAQLCRHPRHPPYRRCPCRCPPARCWTRGCLRSGSRVGTDSTSRRRRASSRSNAPMSSSTCTHATPPTAGQLGTSCGASASGYSRSSGRGRRAWTSWLSPPAGWSSSRVSVAGKHPRTPPATACSYRARGTLRDHRRYRRRRSRSRSSGRNG
mmetsp:Transcript_2615/g.11817  ORF Transcript_2615/g.11817 Transcript_2615/m.11817 type:complete len:235 (+) Transcript_2615:1705-2409(+)